MNRVVHFEIHASDPARVAAFYRQVFDWEIQEWRIPGVELPPENRYWLVGTGSDPAPGINGGLLIRRGAPPTEGQPVNAFICTVDVASIDSTMAKAVSAGGSIALPKMAIRSVGWLAYCKDIEGTIFGVMQADKDAA